MPLDPFERAVVSRAIKESYLNSQRGFISLLRRVRSRVLGGAHWKKRQGFANEQFEQLRYYVCMLREGDVAADSLRTLLIEQDYPQDKLDFIERWATRPE